MSCGVGCRHGLDLVLLPLWHRPVAAAPFLPLAWEHAYAAGDPKTKKKKKSIIIVVIADNKYLPVSKISHPIFIYDTELWKLFKHRKLIATLDSKYGLTTLQ